MNLNWQTIRSSSETLRDRMLCVMLYVRLGNITPVSIERL